jgi:proline iminopeptidase
VGTPPEGYISADKGRLYYRVVGEGPPIVVLHGGPDFDHHYLLPELDRLAASFQLVYYDQRGRGRSADDVEPEDVTIESEIEDLDLVRRHFGFETVAVLGHSWGGLLAMEYAVRRPEHLSHLILYGPAPASAEDARSFRAQLRGSRPPGDVERMQAIAASDRYLAGDLEAEADYYRIHFRVTLRDPDLLELLVERLRANFTPASVLTARAIEHRLYEQTWDVSGYDLVPGLQRLDIPALVLHGTEEFVPLPLTARIARALPRGRLVVLEGRGHFSYLESPDAVHEHVAALFES